MSCGPNWPSGCNWGFASVPATGGGVLVREDASNHPGSVICPRQVAVARKPAIKNVLVIFMVPPELLRRLLNISFWVQRQCSASDTRHCIKPVGKVIGIG